MKLKHLLIGVFIIPRFILSQQVDYITPQLIDLGKLKEGTVVQDSIRLINTGNSPIHIDRIRTGCGCTVAQIPDKKVPPGDTATVSFTLNTKRFRGVIRKTLRIIYEEEIKEGKFIIQADIFSELDYYPRYIHLHNLKINPDTTIQRTITLNNYSEKPITLQKIQSDYGLITISPESGVIRPGDKFILQVNCIPDRTLHKTIYIHIKTDHKIKSEIYIPIFLSILE
jgi:hypothetical protein